MNKKKIYICQWRIRFIKITLALCFVFLLFEAEGQRTAANMNLKGNVRRLYTYTHFATEIVVDKEKLVSYQKGRLLSHIDYIFEKNGLLLAENKYSKQDLIEYSSIYTYENDLLVEITYARAGKFLIERTEYKYDKTGKKTQALVYDSTDSLKNTIVYKYDSLNNLVSERIYNQINFLVTDLRYQYDERGNCILVDNLNTGVHNNKAYREVQRFDDRNNRIYKSFTLRDSLKWEYIARYNKKDSLIYEAVIDGKGNTVSYSTLKYDKHSRRIVMKQYQQDTTISIMETYYKYDKEGKLYMETVQRPKSKESFITRTYFYDDKGNWIYRIDKDERIELDLYIVHSQKLNYY